jgi:hypothetical protein
VWAQCTACSRDLCLQCSVHYGCHEATSTAAFHGWLPACFTWPCHLRYLVCSMLSAVCCQGPSLYHTAHVVHVVRRVCAFVRLLLSTPSLQLHIIGSVDWSRFFLRFFPRAQLGTVYACFCTLAAARAAASKREYLVLWQGHMPLSQRQAGLNQGSLIAQRRCAALLIWVKVKAHPCSLCTRFSFKVLWWVLPGCRCWWRSSHMNACSSGQRTWE